MFGVHWVLWKCRFLPVSRSKILSYYFLQYFTRSAFFSFSSLDLMIWILIFLRLWSSFFSKKKIPPFPLILLLLQAYTGAWSRGMLASVIVLFISKCGSFYSSHFFNKIVYIVICVKCACNWLLNYFYNCCFETLLDNSTSDLLQCLWITMTIDLIIYWILLVLYCVVKLIWLECVVISLIWRLLLS